jgi:hypothetical protein
MAFGDVTVILRPIKFAFLVNPAERDVLDRIIQASLFQWGGLHNPIVPIYRRLPAYWSDFPPRRMSATKICTGYLRVFDPDAAIVCGSSSQGEPFCANNPKLRTLKISEKVLERLATSDKTTSLSTSPTERVTSGSWDGEKVFLRDQGARNRHVDGRLHVARKPRQHNVWTRGPRAKMNSGCDAVTRACDVVTPTCNAVSPTCNAVSTKRNAVSWLDETLFHG